VNLNQYSREAVIEFADAPSFIMLINGSWIGQEAARLTGGLLPDP
jgi:hypothetical protein